MTNKTAILTVQKWGNSLAVRVPAKIAASAHFYSGTPVEMIIQEKGTVMIKLIGKPTLSLDERLKLFDPEKHGGEIMGPSPVGLEKLDD